MSTSLDFAQVEVVAELEALNVDEGMDFVAGDAPDASALRNT